MSRRVTIAVAMLLLPSLLLNGANPPSWPIHLDDPGLSRSPLVATSSMVANRFEFPRAASPVTSTASEAVCSVRAGIGDHESQIKAVHSGCWLAMTADPRVYGARPAIRNFSNVSTTAANKNITVAEGSFTISDVGDYIVIFGAGPYEGRYIGQISGVTGPDAITVVPAPTLSMANFSTIIYYGPDSATAINSAFAAAAVLGMPSAVPPGTYMVASGITCPVPNVNNFNVPPPLCGGSPGATLMAAARMPAVLTIGGFGNSSDFSQFIRNSPIPGNGLTIDCNFIASDGYYQPFSQETYPDKFQVKNCLKHYFSLGATTAPTASGAITAIGNKTTRDIYYVPVMNISSAHPPVVTTAIDHGIPPGPPYRTVTIVGAKNIPQPGPISFIAKRSGARTIELHNVDGSAWPAFSGSASLALTMPTNSVIHPVFAVTAGNPAQVSMDGDLNLANGQTWCLYGLGGSGTLTGVPDGCYPVSNVGGFGGDGPSTFTVPVNTTGFAFTGGGITFLQNHLTQASFTGAVAATILTVSAVSSGSLEAGHQINDSSSGISAGTVITGTASFNPTGCSANCTGSGGTGTYAVNNPQTVTSRILTGSVPGDVGFYLNSIADAEFIANDGGGTRFGYYANPATSGWNGKYIANHVWISAEQGWLIAGHVLGGMNALIGEQCDGPIVFCGQFSGQRNSAVASFLNGGGFNWVIDGAAWMFRLENGADLTVNGGGMNGQSASLRVSELSSYAMRGNPSQSGSQTNYHRFGFATSGTTTLYSMQDSSDTGVTCPAAAPSALFQVNGGIVVHC